MRLKNYLTEKIRMPVKQRKRFEDMIEDFLVEYPNYKQISTEKFMADLEKYDYKSMSVLLNNLGMSSLAQFINKYQEIIDTMHESVHTDLIGEYNDNKK